MKNDRIPPNPHPVKPPPNLPPPMSTDKQDIDNQLAMAILNGLSGPNACKGADERRRMIPLHVADQAVAACEKEIAALKAEVERLTKAHSDALADFWAIHKGYFELKAEVERLWKEGK